MYHFMAELNLDKSTFDIDLEQFCVSHDKTLLKKFLNRAEAVYEFTFKSTGLTHRFRLDVGIDWIIIRRNLGENDMYMTGLRKNDVLANTAHELTTMGFNIVPRTVRSDTTAYGVHARR